MDNPAYSAIDKQLDSLLKTAIDYVAAEKGMIQVYNNKTETLKVVSSHGLGVEFLNMFKEVKAFDPTACGRCVGLKTPIIVNDVLLDASFFPYKHIIDMEKIRSAKSFPLYVNQKTIIGVFSTYSLRQFHVMHNVREIPATHLTEIVQLLQKLPLTVA